MRFQDLCFELGYEAHAQPQDMPMQLCSALQVVVHHSTAGECLLFANTRTGETEAVSTQIANTAMTDLTTGFCVYNSGSSGTWQLLTTAVDTVVCDTPGSRCACKPRDDYVTLGTDAAIQSVQLNYDTDPHGAVYTRQTCCALCSATAPPSAPPSPPAAPESPRNPPYPPGAPPPPPHPLIPPGTLVADPTSGSVGITLAHKCLGVILDDHGMCHLMKDNVPLEHPGTSATYVQGREAYYMHAPPPPPHYPQSASCIGFMHHQFEDIPTGVGYDLPGFSTLVVDDIDSTLFNVSNPFPAPHLHTLSLR